MRGFFIGLLVGAACAAVGFWVLRPSTPSPGAPDAAAATAAPAYMLVLGEIYDRDSFLREYAARLPPLYAKFGGEYIAIGGGADVLEGDLSPTSYVIGKWPSKQAAMRFWTSPEYDELRRARIDNQWGDFDVLLVEGLAVLTGVAPAVQDRND